MKKKTGRKPKNGSEAKTASLHLRITNEEKEKLKQKAKEKGLTVTELVLTLLEK